MITSQKIKMIKFLALNTMVEKGHIWELQQEKDNPLIAELLWAVTLVYNAQRSSQLVKGEGQGARIQNSKIAQQIKEAREIVKGLNLEGLE